MNELAYSLVRASAVRGLRRGVHINELAYSLVRASAVREYAVRARGLGMAVS